MSRHESGYFDAGTIAVPAEFLDAERHVVFQQSDPYRSFVQVVPQDGSATYAIDFIGNEQGALLMVVPEAGDPQVHILLALGTPAGDYGYRAYFYKERTNLVAYQHDGLLTVGGEQKQDCGHFTLGVINSMRSKNQNQRMAICGACPFNMDGVCGECGCNISHKTSAPGESCPIGKWGPDRG